MKKRNLLPLLLITPIFLANAPMPYRGPEIYASYEIENLSCAPDAGVSGQYIYSFNLKNTGDGYIDLSHLQVFTPDGYYNTGGGIRNIAKYDDLVIAPSCSFNIEFVSILDLSIDDIQCDVYGYLKENIVETAATYSNISTFSKVKVTDRNEKESYEYSFTCSYTKNTNEFGNHYSPIFQISDGENDYYFHGDLLQDSYKFNTLQDLDETKLTIKSYTFIEGYEYYRIRGINEVAVSAFMWVMLALFVFSVPVVIVIGGLVVLIIFIVKRKKNRGESQETTGNNEKDNS